MNIQTPRRSGRWADDGPILAALLGLFLFLLARTVADPDLWGHVKFGGDLFRTGAIKRPDPYSYMSGGQPWINHEWLAEAAFWGAWSWFGGTGLVVLKMVVGLAIVGLLIAHLMRRGLPALRAGIVLLLAYPLIAIGTSTVRPHMFTYLGLLLVLLAIEAADRGRPRWLWTLPVVFALWANLHGGFIAGVAILGIWMSAHAVLGVLGRARPDWPPARTLSAVFVLSLVATLLNPWGIEHWRFLLETATVPRPEITEWAPTPILTFEGIFYLLLLGLGAISLVAAGGRVGIPLSIVWAVAAVLPLIAVRHLPLFALSAVVITGPWIGSLREPRAGAAPGWLGPVFVLAGVAMAALAIPHLRGPRIDGRQRPFPARAVALLDASGASGNLAIHFNWGEYAIWHLAPEIKVSLDGRRETVYDEEAYQTNLRFLFGAGDWDRLLTEHPTDMALVGSEMPSANLLRLKEPWTVVYQDSLAAIFAKEGSPQARRLEDARPGRLPVDGDGLFFP